MSLQIILDHNDVGFYTPGSNVSGRVQLTAAKEQSVACVSVLFTGRCKVKLTRTERYTSDAIVESEIQNDEPVILDAQTRSHTYRSRGYYFAYSMNLTENTVYQAGTYSWPFSFCVPYYAEQVSTATLSTLNLEADRFQPIPPWKGSEDPPQSHMLPESLEYRDHDSGKINVDEANIEYKLTSKLSHDKASYHLFSGDQEAVVDLTLRVPQKIVNPRIEEKSQSYTIKSLRVLPSHADGHLTLREKTHSLFHKSDLPTVAFKVAISFPHAIPLPLSASSVPKTLPFSISVTRAPVQHVGPSGTQLLGQDIPTPKVTLKKLRLRLVAVTGVRDSGTNQSTHPVAPKEEIDLFNESIKSVAGQESIEVPPWGAWLDLGKELGISFQNLKEKYRDRLVSTFSTYNIWRSYRLEFKVELSCVEEEMKFECEDEQAVPIVLLRDEGGAFHPQGGHTYSQPAVFPQPQASPHQFPQSLGQGNPQQSWMYAPQVPQPQFTPYQSTTPVHGPIQEPASYQQHQQPGYSQSYQSHYYPQQTASYSPQDNGSAYNPPESQYYYQSQPQEGRYPSQGHIGGAKRDIEDSQ